MSATRTATLDRPKGKTARRRREPLDPVTSYAARVILSSPAAELAAFTASVPDGFLGRVLERADPVPVIAGRPVRLAGMRHLRNLANRETPVCPYYYDVAAAQHIIDFFPTFLSLENGEPFVLPEWLQFSYGSIFGWKSWRGDRHGKRRFRHGFFETSKGSGKALALDTPIPTPTGWSTMGELRVGDRVFDEAGRPVTVTATSAVRTDHACFEVVFDDGASIVADAEHLWFTEMRSGGRADGRIASAGIPMADRGQWKRGVRTTAEIARTLRYPNGQHQSANHSVPLAGALGTPSVPLIIDPYVLGVWLGDGDSDCTRVTVGDADVELVGHLVAAGVAVSARQGGKVHAGRYRLSEPTQEGHGLTAKLRTLGVLNGKHIPASYLRSGVEQRLAMLQGLMDTDGTINPANGACEFCTTSAALAAGVHELILSLGIKCAVNESAAKLYGREVSRRWRMHFHPPVDVPVFRLTRKRQHQRQRHTRRRLSGDRRIVDVRPVPSVPVRCITVDGSSSLFLAGRAMVPTHNSPSAAGIGLYGVAFDDEPYAEIYSTGFDKGQASIIVNDAIRMANASPDLLEDLIVDKYNVAHPSSGSYFRAMSSQHRSKSGPRPQMVLSDEIHEHRDGTVVSKAEAGFKSRPQPLGLKFTNSGSDPNSFCGQLHQKSLDVLEGTVIDEEWFAYVCSLDPCAKHAGEGYRQPLDGCPDCDDWTAPAVWPKIAPALGVVIQPKYLQDAVTEALTVPSQFNMKRRLNFCLWTQTRNVWIPSDRWDACKVESVPTGNPQRRPCAAAFDLSSKNDLSGFVVAIRYDDPPSDTAPEVAEIEGITATGDRGTIRITLNFTIDLVPFAWIPRETMLARIQNERIPYDLWEREGHIIVTPGPVMDHQAIYEHVVASEKTFGIQRIGYDEKDATMLAVKLRDEARLGDKVLAIGQGKKLSEAIKLVAKVLVPARRIRHNGHPVLKMCIGNVEPHDEDRLGAVWIEKAGELKRIDLAVCTVMAVQQVMVLPAFQAEPQVFFAGGGKR